MLICLHQHLRRPKWADKRKHGVNANEASGQVHFSPKTQAHLLLLNLLKVKKSYHQYNEWINTQITPWFKSALCTVWSVNSQNQTLIVQHAHCLCCGQGNDWEHPIATANSHVEVAVCVCVPPLWVGNIILLSLSQLTLRERYTSLTHTHTSVLCQPQPETKNWVYCAWHLFP